MKKFTLNTRNKEAYEKLNALNYSNDVVIDITVGANINKILKNINRHGNNISVERIGDYLLLKKLNPMTLNVYLKK